MNARARKLRKLFGSGVWKTRQNGILFGATMCLISLTIVFLLTGGSDYWFQPFVYSTIYSYEDASISEDFVLYGNASCSSQRKYRLAGKTTVHLNVPSLDETALLHPDLEKGGHFVPQCPHSQKVAIIVPYRDREDNLKIFLYNMHVILKRQLIEYHIFVIEQTGTEPFNRAALFNVGFVESLKLNNFDCFIFHDVDLIPDDDRNIYKCPSKPRHMAVFMSNWKYLLPYHHFFGGVSALSRKHYEQINGCSNRFWGWGGEDDDMYNRIRSHKLSLTRYAKEIARYTMLSHKTQVLLASRADLLKHVDLGYKYYKTSGLSDLKYNLTRILQHQLYTLVQVRLSRTADATPLSKANTTKL